MLPYKQFWLLTLLIHCATSQPFSYDDTQLLGDGSDGLGDSSETGSGSLGEDEGPDDTLSPTTTQLQLGLSFRYLPTSTRRKLDGEEFWPGAASNASETSTFFTPDKLAQLVATDMLPDVSASDAAAAVDAVVEEEAAVSSRLAAGDATNISVKVLVLVDPNISDMPGISELKSLAMEVPDSFFEEAVQATFKDLIRNQIAVDPWITVSTVEAPENESSAPSSSSPNSPPASPPKNEDADGGLSGGAIATIVLLSILGIAVLGLIGIYIYKRKSKPVGLGPLQEVGEQKVQGKHRGRSHYHGSELFGREEL